MMPLMSSVCSVAVACVCPLINLLYVCLSIFRFSQESWSNLRKRLVQLHINFYATTFVVMLLVYSFPSW